MQLVKSPKPEVDITIFVLFHLHEATQTRKWKIL